jgi:SM-20-related protein
MSPVIDLARIEEEVLQSRPYGWAAIDRLFEADDAEALAATFPRDNFAPIAGQGGEKDYRYDARPLIAMGAETVSRPEELSEAWLRLAQDLLSHAYRAALSSLTGCPLVGMPVEVNMFHYGPGSCLGPHVDLPEKIVTHVLYFNRSWDRRDGGCLSILRSRDPADRAAEVVPIVGASAVLVRSEKSFHAVAPVANGCRESRRSATVTFYRPGSVSSMWPLREFTPGSDHRAGSVV